jgi:hypothetical protein
MIDSLLLLDGTENRTFHQSALGEPCSSGLQLILSQLLLKPSSSPTTTSPLISILLILNLHIRSHSLRRLQHWDFVAFAEHPIDVGIIEVGMGGEWDATNVIAPDVAVITPIGMDHMEYLGNSLTEIARTKAGIIKEGAVAIFAHQEEEAAIELMRRAAEGFCYSSTRGA